MAVLPSLLETGSMAHIASTLNLGRLSKGDLITIIVVSVILIVACVWLFRGTKRHD